MHLWRLQTLNLGWNFPLPPVLILYFIKPWSIISMTCSDRYVILFGDAIREYEILKTCFWTGMHKDNTLKLFQLNIDGRSMQSKLLVGVVKGFVKLLVTSPILIVVYLLSISLVTLAKNITVYTFFKSLVTVLWVILLSIVILSSGNNSWIYFLLIFKKITPMYFCHFPAGKNLFKQFWPAGLLIIYAIRYRNSVANQEVMKVTKS